MEQKLSMQLGEEEEEERKGETRSDSKDEGAKGRKRRSLDTGMLCLLIFLIAFKKIIYTRNVRSKLAFRIISQSFRRKKHL